MPYRETPPFFPVNGILSQRCLLYIKDKQPTDKYEATFLSLWEAIWFRHIDVSKADALEGVLSETFDEKTVREILAAGKSQEYKNKLIEVTEEALQSGAFGAPWFVVKNAKGEKEPFFGSDR